MCTRVEKGQVREGCLQINPTIALVSGENAIHEWGQKSTLIQLQVNVKVSNLVFLVLDTGLVSCFPAAARL